MASSLSTVNLNATPQTEKAAKGQKQNHAGGYSFKIDPMERAKRFLILGSEGTAYQSGQKLSKESAKVIVKLAETDSTALVDLIVSVSLGGRAPKQDPALFALAIASSYGSDDNKRYARAQLSKVARTGTHLFLFVGYVKQFRGWGRGLRSAVAAWYLDKDIDKLAYQTVKYQNREGYTHGDVMRLAHPARPNDPAFNGLARWILRKDETEIPEIVRGYLKAHKPGASTDKLVKLIKKYGLSWEMLPSEALSEAKIWEALLDGNLPLGALIRQLPRLTRLGVIKPLGEHTKVIVKRLKDPEEIRKSRQHPLNLLIAQRTYASGQSVRGKSSWTPVREITEALDEAFYKAFDFVEPTGKRFFQSTDISGSMGVGLGDFGITAMEAALAMVMVTLRTEPYTFVTAFQYGLEPIPQLTKNMSLTQIKNALPRWTGGSTNAAAPMEYALAHKIEADVFIVYTDSETYAGSQHAHEALAAYRKAMGIDAKLIVVAMTSTGFSIADPNDPGMLDVVGFDTAVPTLISEFSKGL